MSGYYDAIASKVLAALDDDDDRASKVMEAIAFDLVDPAPCAKAEAHITELEARLKAATERCSVQIDLGPCLQCQADLALLDGTPEQTQ